MKITEEFVTFKELKPKDLFKLKYPIGDYYNFEGEIFMKLQEEAKSVSLTLGNIEMFHKDIEVIPLDGELKTWFKQ